MALEVKNHLDTPAGPSSWVFCRPEWASLGKKNSSKVLILYNVRKLIKNRANIIKRVGSQNGLVMSYSRLEILKIMLLFRHETLQ